MSEIKIILYFWFELDPPPPLFDDCLQIICFFSEVSPNWIVNASVFVCLTPWSNLAFNQLVIKSPFINPLSTSVNKLDSSLARLIQTFTTSSCFNHFYFCTWCKFSRMSSMIKLFSLRDNTDWTEFSLINSVINYIFLWSVNNNWVLIFVKVT